MNKHKTTVKTHHLMHCTFCVVPHILEKDLNARAAFKVVYPVLQSLNLVETCKLLPSFLALANF